MNDMTIDEMIKVLQAAKAGKNIECRYKNSIQCRYKNDYNDPWLLNHNPIWDFNTCDYRVAPEPREIKQPQPIMNSHE